MPWAVVRQQLCLLWVDPCRLGFRGHTWLWEGQGLLTVVPPAYDPRFPAPAQYLQHLSLGSPYRGQPQGPWAGLQKAAWKPPSQASIHLSCSLLLWSSPLGECVLSTLTLRRDLTSGKTGRHSGAWT